MAESTFNLTDASTTDTIIHIAAALAAIEYPGPVVTEDFYGDPVKCVLCEAPARRVDSPPGWWGRHNLGSARFFNVIAHADTCPWVLARTISDRPYEWVPPWESSDG